MDHNGPSGGAGEEVGVPGQEPAAVFEERDEAAYEWVRRRGKTVDGGAVRFVDADTEEKESPEREGEEEEEGHGEAQIGLHGNFANWKKLLFNGKIFFFFSLIWFRKWMMK